MAQSFADWKKSNPNGNFQQWKSSSSYPTSAPANNPTNQNSSTAPKVPNFTVEWERAQKANPNLNKNEFEKQFIANNPGAAADLEATKKKLQQTTASNQKKAQENYLKQGGTLKPGEVYDPYAQMQKASQTGQDIQGTIQGQEADLIRKNIGGTTDYKTPIVNQQYGNAKNTFEKQPPASKQPPAPLVLTGDETPEESLQKQLDYQKQLSAFQAVELGSVSGQVSDFASQLKQNQQQVQDLVNSLNSKQEGLGDTVNSVLQDMAESGAQVELTPEALKMIGDISLDTPADQVDDKINQITQSQTVEPQVQPLPMAEPIPSEAVLPKSQQYEDLKKSGLNAGQIVQQDPSMMKEVVPDGSILEPNMGVSVIQTPLGEGYKTPSGMVIPKDYTTGFANLGAMTSDQIKKMSFADLMAIDLSTQKTASDLKQFYNAQTFQKMAERNDREYQIATLDMDKFYNSENNRVSESKLKVMQDLELEKMRQDLSKNTTLQQLGEAQSKTANIMKAQMDAWGLEGSSTALAAMSAHSLKFAQEASTVTQTYDINIMQMAMASTQAQMQFTNKVTELNQTMQVQKLQLRSEYLGKKDELDSSVLLSNIEKITEDKNMYRDYVGKVYENEQATLAAAAEAEKEAKTEMWEKQKYYGEQLGMLVSVDQDGMPQPLLSEDGQPVMTLSGRKSDLEESQFQFDQVKFEEDVRQFGMDYALRENQQSFSQELDVAKFEEDVRQFGMDYALKEQGQYFNQDMDVAKFDQDNEQFYATMQGFDMKEDSNGDWIGTNKTGEIVNFGQGAMPAMPLKSKYDYNVVSPNEIRFNVPPGKLNSRGECGMLVNDALNGGPGLMGDSYESKMGVVNSDMPVAGGAFVEKINGLASGHTGLVEKVNPDGSFEIRESNYHGKWNVTTETIQPGSARWKTIVEQGGFYDPIKGGTSAAKKSKGVTGDGPTAKFIQEQMKAGFSKEKAMDMAAKAIEKGTLPGGSSNDSQVMALDNALSALDDLKKSSGKSGAVGAGWQKIFRGEDTNFRAGSGPANFKAKFDNVMSTLTIPQLGTLKGPMSDKDIAFLKSAATSLSLNTSEKAFDETLNKMIEAYKRLQQDAKNQGTTLEAVSGPKNQNSYYNPMATSGSPYDSEV